jgi:hypothetical protein
MLAQKTRKNNPNKIEPTRDDVLPVVKVLLASENIFTEMPSAGVLWNIGVAFNGLKYQYNFLMSVYGKKVEDVYKEEYKKLKVAK